MFSLDFLIKFHDMFYTHATLFPYVLIKNYWMTYYLCRSHIDLKEKSKRINYANPKYPRELINGKTRPPCVR